MIKISFLLVCICTTFISKGQTTNSLKTLVKFDLGSQGLGFSYEPRISNKLTIDLSTGVGGAYDVSDDNLSYEVATSAYYISITPKFFYSIQRRKSKAKNTMLNSGNYFGIRFKSVNTFAPQTDLHNHISENVSILNVHWGIQRAIGGHWLFNYQMGVGYAEDVNCSCGTLYPALDFKFSYVLGK